MIRWLAMLLAVAAPAAAQDLARADGSLRADVLLPLYAGYAGRAEALAAAAPDCAGDWRADLRPAYADSVLAWRRLEAAGAGPAVAGDTPATVFFWPDKHGTAGRQLAAALRSRDPTLTSPAELTGKSVGLKSLATLEVLIYGEALPPEAGSFACRYAEAIAEVQAAAAAGLLAAARSDPASGAGLNEAMFRGMLGTLDTLIALDLERPLGADIGAARGQRARAWRSGLSLPLIAAALETVEQVYTAPGGFSAQVRSSAELAPFDDLLRNRLTAARATIGAIGPPLHLAVADPAARPAVERLLDELRGVRRLLVERLAPALGLASGFNALDGD